jgi:hypothetical protein
MLLKDRRTTIRSVLKVVYFLRTVWGIFLHSHTQPDREQGIKKFLRHLPTTLVPSPNLTKFVFPLPRGQTLRSRIWQMKSKNASVGLSGCSGQSKIFVRLVMLRE